MKVFPNPKINVGLYVVAERPDGFHDIETVFYPVENVTDVLDVEPIDSGVDFCVTNRRMDCSDEDNLCVRAFRLLQAECGFSGGIRMRLEKHIPMGGGLGGGSSDAAFALKAVNEVYRLRLSNDELKSLAARLGSDVAFFIDNVPSFASGRGEILEPVKLDLSDWTLSLIVPPYAISTAEAYRSIASRPAPVDLRRIADFPVSQWKDRVSNDFERPMSEKFPVFTRLKSYIYSLGAEYVSLSGSGSTVYVLGHEKYSVPSDFFTC